MKLQLILSKDGSHTLYREDIDEHYHSTHGAIQESNHVFIEKGLKEIVKSKNDIIILEIGFGTGLNALLTSFYTDFRIKYIGVEAFPIEREIVSELNYSQLLENDESEVIFRKIHDADWGSYQTVTNSFSLYKIKDEIQNIQIPTSIDLVYFDAFAPNVQPEMWNISIFQKLFEAMSPHAIFVTYCAKGQVRRDLQDAGFVVERLEGPPGKREMLRARKS